MRELNEGVNQAERKIFKDIRLSNTANVDKAAGSIRSYLGISLKAQSACKTSDEALRVWRNAVEDAGIFVFKHSFIMLRKTVAA